MELLIGLIINYGLPVSLLVLAFFTGKILESRHYKSIHRREQALSNRPAVTSRQWDLSRDVAFATLTAGSVVVSIDYFKRFLAIFFKLVGGRVRSFESSLDRARREAVLRMKESCPNADIYVNMRIDTCMLSNTTAKGQNLSGVEVIAYATAIGYTKEPSHEICAQIPG